MNSATGTASNSTSATYNISSTCKYRLPCGWCERRDCMCTHMFSTFGSGLYDDNYLVQLASVTCDKTTSNTTDKSNIQIFG